MDPVTFLAETKELKLAEFLAGRGPLAHVIAPESVLEAMRSIRPKLACTVSTDWRDEIDKAPNVFIFDIRPGYPSAHLRRKYPKKNIFVIDYDIVLALVCRRKKLNNWQPGPEHRYGVLTTPRSGSTFLGNLLTQLGLGHPIEHVRTPVVQLVKNGYPFDDIMERIETIDSRNDIFGTKFISTFVRYAFTGRAEDFAAFLYSRRYKLIRLKRGLADQAVSSYFASQTNRWHLYKDMEAPQADVPYDFAEIKAVYDRFCAEDDFLEKVLAKLPEDMIFRLEYDSLDADPLGVTNAVRSFLNIDVPGHEISLDSAPKKISARNKKMADFRARFTAELLDAAA